MRRPALHRRNENGVAMIFALVLVLVLSVIAASLLFISRSETWSSTNYRMMTQARYGAEAGINAAANYLINVYTPPGNTGADQYGLYTQTGPLAVPGSALPATVQFGGNFVALTSGNPTVPFAYTYPFPQVQTAFNNAVTGTIQSGNDTLSYTAYATLLSMEQLSVYGSATPGTVQTWLITADGNIVGLQNSQVEVSAVLEQAPVPTFQYAAFATNQGCGALQFSGGGSTDSYDSSAITFNANGSVATQNIDGNVGSNGNLNEAGAPTVINGTLSTPALGVGNCSSGNVTPWTDTGNAQVTGGVVTLPQTVNYPTPSAPNPMPPTTNTNLNNAASCASLSGCSTSPLGGYQLASGTTSNPALYGNLTINSGATIHLEPGVYNINSLTLNGNATVVIDPPTPSTAPSQVTINIAGAGQSIPLDLTGGSLTNPSYNPSNLQFVYAGTGTLKLEGGAAAAGIVYAPNATVTFNGGSNWYGAAIGQFVDDKGGTALNYDRRLQKALYTLGNWELDSFTWKKY